PPLPADVPVLPPTRRPPLRGRAVPPEAARPLAARTARRCDLLPPGPPAALLRRAEHPPGGPGSGGASPWRTAISERRTVRAARPGAPLPGAGPAGPRDRRRVRRAARALPVHHPGPGRLRGGHGAAPRRRLRRRGRHRPRDARPGLRGTHGAGPPGADRDLLHARADGGPRGPGGPGHVPRGPLRAGGERRPSSGPPWGCPVHRTPDAP